MTKPFIKTKPARMKRNFNESLDAHLDDEEVRTNHPTKLGLPHQAFAVVKDINDPGTWYLPHHTNLVKRAVAGKIGLERTVEWGDMEIAVQLVSRRGIEGQRVALDPEYIIAAARHLASHYQKAGRPLPDALAVLV